MLADRSLKVASDIVSDYVHLNIVHFMQLAISAGQSRGSSAYGSQVNEVVKGFTKVLRESVFNKYPPDFYGNLEKLEFAPLLPPKLARKMISGFSGDVVNHINSNEIAVMLNAANSLIANCNGYIGFSNSLEIHTESVEDGAVSFDFSMPHETFGENLSGLVECYKNFDRIFMATAELTGSQRVSPRIYKASSSILTTVILAAQEHYVAIIAAYSGIVEAANKTIQLYKNIADLRSSKVPEAAIKPIEEAKGQAVDAYVDEFLNRVFERYSKDVESETRVNELRNELQISSRLAIDYVINGARISLSIENFNGTNLALLPPDAITGQSAMEQMQSLRQVENAISLIKSNNPDIVKAIGPIDHKNEPLPSS